MRRIVPEAEPPIKAVCAECAVTIGKYGAPTGGWSFEFATMESGCDVGLCDSCVRKLAGEVKTLADDIRRALGSVAEKA